MARTDNLNNYLTDVADAIKEKTGDTSSIPANQFDEKIKEIKTGIDINRYNCRIHSCIWWKC